MIPGEHLNPCAGRWCNALVDPAVAVRKSRFIAGARGHLCPECVAEYVRAAGLGK